MEQLELMDRALAATVEGLELADATLNQATAATAALEGTVRGLGAALEGTGSTVDVGVDLVGEQLPDTISASCSPVRLELWAW